MKTLCLSCLWLVLGACASVGLALGPEAETDLNAALKRAKSEAKMLFIVCGRDACSNTRAVRGYVSQHAIRLPESDFIYVEVNCDDRKQNAAFDEHYSVEGHILPFVVVADSKGKQLAARSGYGKAQEFSSLIRTAQKKSTGGGETEAEKPESTEPSEGRSELRTWTPRNGVAFVAALDEVKGGIVVFKKKNGSKMQVPMNILTDADQKDLKAMQK